MRWIENFYGYGSWKARYWFVSLDESGGEQPEEVDSKLNYFFKHYPEQKATLCDLRALYKQVPMQMEGPKATLFSNRYEYRFGSHAVANSIWKNLIAFSFGHEGKPLPDLMAYQKGKFATGSGKREALIRLYPLPSSNDHAWYYSWLQLPELDFLKSRSKYEQHTNAARVNTILQKVKKHQPEVVLMYGMKKINDLKKSVIEVFPESRFELNQVVKKLIPQHHITTIGKTKLIISTQIPALRHNRIETGFDWAEFGRRVKDIS